MADLEEINLLTFESGGCLLGFLAEEVERVAEAEDGAEGAWAGFGPSGGAFERILVLKNGGRRIGAEKLGEIIKAPAGRICPLPPALLGATAERYFWGVAVGEGKLILLVRSDWPA